MKVSKNVMTSIRVRTNRLIDLHWKRIIGDRHIYSLADIDREACYQEVCKNVAQAVARLRRIGGFELAYKTVGQKMANDCLFALVD